MYSCILLRGNIPTRHCKCPRCAFDKEWLCKNQALLPNLQGHVVVTSNHWLLEKNGPKDGVRPHMSRITFSTNFRFD